MPLLEEWSDRFRKESPYAESLPRGVKCTLCPNYCVIPEGKSGICRTRVVVEGKLINTAYGNPCAVHNDPVEKKPLFHFLPGTAAFSVGTAGCNFSCLNCQNWEISQSGPSELRHLDLPPVRVVEEAIKAGAASIAYTYTEPVVFFEYMLETARIARFSGIRNLLISNGYINPQPLNDLCEFLDAANIDLKAFSDPAYAELCGGRLQPVLDTLLALKNRGVWLEITVLLIPGLTDSPEMIGEMCSWLASRGFCDTPLHFSRFHPRHRLDSLPVTPLASLERARNIALSAGIRYVYLGNVPGTNAESTICPECSDLLIERDGFTVVANHLSDGSCRRCGFAIAGIWR